MAGMVLEPVSMAVEAGVAPPQSRRAVAMLAEGLEERAPHEVAALRVAVQRIAALLGLPAREHAVADAEAAACYCVPASTLSLASAAAHGIVDEGDLWGGVVPLPFVATKLVSHPLWPDAVVVPPGWIALSGIERCTLPGYAVFSHADARAAGLRLLRDGAVRIKCPHARGGHGQHVAGDRERLLHWLDAAPVDTLAAGLVLERDLARSRTHSIGSARLPGHEISYHGSQRSTRDASGAEVYAGSRLEVHAGGCETLLARLAGQPLAGIAAAAVDYDRIVRDGHGVLASRCNYDVIEGEDASGRYHAGVLEQSWRFGGASLAELLAIEALSRGAAGPVVAETVETYAPVRIPDGAVVSWRGDDGFRTPLKYARIVGDGRPA